MSFHTRMTVSSCTTLGIIELGNLDKTDCFVPGHNHLGYSFAGIYNEFFRRKVYQQHLYLAAIVGINGAGRVQHRYSVL